MSVSERLAAVQALIENEVDSHNFLFGKVYGQLTEIIKEAKQQEEAFANLSALYLTHKPEVLKQTVESISDVVTGKNVKGE
jgi:hypothetical protein